MPDSNVLVDDSEFPAASQRLAASVQAMILERLYREEVPGALAFTRVFSLKTISNDVERGVRKMVIEVAQTKQLPTLHVYLFVDMREVVPLWQDEAFVVLRDDNFVEFAWSSVNLEFADLAHRQAGVPKAYVLGEIKYERPPEFSI